jgi:putative NADH-flavin reductase
MESNKKIAVIGGTGKSGQYVVRELIKRGYPFKVLVRNPEHFTLKDPLAEVVIGNVLDADIVHKLLQGCSAVVSTLGLGIPPSEPDIFTKATANILAAMNELGIRRYIVSTGLNVSTPSDHKGPKTQMATDWMYANYPISTKNKQEEFEMLTESDVDWTMVRLPMIALTDDRPEITVSLKDCPGDGISASSLAGFLVDKLQGKHYIRRAPFIANK